MTGLILGVAILAFVLIAIFMAIALGSKNVDSDKTDFLPYEKIDRLFSPAERSFLGVLDIAAGSQYRCFAKVRIADVVSVRKIKDRSIWQKAFNRINSKHFDFVICKSDDLSIVCVVELNDKSHSNTSRKSRDELVFKICKEISLPLLFFPAKASYTIDEIRSGLDSSGFTQNNSITQ